MKRRGRRQILTVVLCLAILFADVGSMGMQVSAKEAGVEAAAVSDRENPTEGSGDENSPSEDGGVIGATEENKETGRGADSLEAGDNSGGESESSEDSGKEQDGDGAKKGESAAGENEDAEGGNRERTETEDKEQSEETVPENTIEDSEEETVSENTVEADAEAAEQGTRAVTASGKCGDNLTWTLEDGTLTISGTGEMYHDYWGESSKAPWMTYSDSIHRLVIEPGVTDIGQYAFYKCSNLKTLSIPDSVTSIAEFAFGYCSNLMTLSIPDSVTHIGRFAFEYCSSLSSIVIPDGIEKIYDAAFSHCDSLKKVTLPASVTTLGMGVFSGCTSLSSAGPIGGGYDFEFGWIDAIPSNAFYGSKLKYILIPDGITKIGTDAFAYCENLEKVVIPASVNMFVNHVYDGHNQLITAGPIGGGYNIEFGWTDAIPDHAFDHCSKLKEIQISGSISSIGAYAFNMCSSLENLIIPDSVREIGDGAFNNCNAILELTIPNNVYKIGDGAFSQCDSLSKMIIPNNVMQIGLEIFYGCDNLEHVSLSNQLTKIQGTFARCTNLSSVSIPSSVKEIGYMTFYDCSKLSDIYYSGSEAQWKGIEFSSDCKTALSNVAIHYNSEWDIIKDPMDINQNDITVNGKGYAYANFTLKNNTGEIQRNARITYTVDGRSYEAISDEEGYIALKSPLLENTTGKNEKKTIIVQDMTLHYASGKTETLGYKVTMDVTVTPLSFTQTWELGTEGSLEGSLGFGAGVTVGVANVEMGLAKAKLKGSAGGILSVEHSFEDGNRNLILHQNYESKVAAKAKIGPAAQLSFLGQDLDVDIVKAGAGMVSGKSVGIGLKIDNYNPDDTAQIANIGKFMLGTQAQAGGDMMMLKLAERAGFDFWNLEQCGADISLEANADAGSIKFGDKSVGTLASIGAEQMIGYTIKRDKTDSSKKLAFEYELASAASVGAIDIVGLQKDIFSRSDNHNLQLSANFDAENQVENVTVKKEEKSAQGFMREKGTAESVTVTYDREVLEEIKQNISVIGNFVSGSIQYILGDAQENLYKQLDLLPVKGSYLATKTNLVKTKADFEIGLKFGVGVKAGIGLEGVSSCEYETAGGTYEGGQRYITNTNEIEAAVKENSYSLDQLVGEPLQTIGERVKDFLQDNADKLINGVKNGFAVIEQATLGSASQWLVHIVSLREGKTRSTEFPSYEITAYNTEITSGRMAYGNTETEAMEYMAFTLGDPYYVYVTDESENEIMDYSAQPLTLELSYTDEMLTSAGFTEAEINNIAVYMYSQVFCGYVCVGGDVNAETKTVSVEITKPGQYVLAIDSIAPTVKSITISQNTNRPLIIVEFNEISGFREFSMKLDNEEVIATANWNKYYNKLYNSFSYQVERELTDGKHSCSVYAVDTAGNAMSDFYETEFYIGKATVNIFFNAQNHGISPYPYTGIERGSIIEEPPAPTAEGYTFTGWFKEKDCINKWDFATDTVEEDITLYAGWTENKAEDEEGKHYRVSFDILNHGIAPEAYTDVKENSTISEPVAPTAAGYRFIGWFKDHECTIPWQFDVDIVTSDLTLYAGWAPEDEFGDILPEDIPESGVIPSGLWIAAIKDHAYTGKPIKPEVHVYDSKTRLKQGQDYTITYKNNVNAKEASAAKKAPTIVVKGKGNYAGTETETFTIQQINLNDPEIVCGNLTSSYTSKVQKKIPAINYGGKKLTSNKDFVVSYPDLSRGVTEAYCAPGTYEILLTAKKGGNYTGTRSVGLTITKSTLISKAAVDKIPKQPYTGYAIEPDLTVRLQNNILVKDTDYTVAYTDNKEIGKATAVLTGIGDYAGTKKVTFNIVGTSLSKADVYKITDQTYNGSEQKPDIIVTMNGSKLQNEIDYTVTYTNNLNAGKATVTITGINAYTGVIKRTFRINAYDLKADAEYKIDGLQNRITCKYLKDGCTPKIELTFDGTNLTEGTDYTLSYKNNKTVTTSETRNFPTMIVKGKGNFRGTVSKTFAIVGKPLDDAEFPVTLRVADKGFADKAGNYISKPILIDTNGKKLVFGKDYDNNVIYMRENGSLLSKTSRLSVGDKVKVKVTGKGAYSGQLEALYEIKMVDFSKAKISIVSQPYTGREITLDQNYVTVQLRGANLNYGTDYEILPESYRNNLKKGTAEVTIVGKGKYGGMKTVKFRIISKKFEWFWRMLE